MSGVYRPTKRNDDGTLCVSLAVMHRFYRFCYALGYDPDCETMPTGYIVEDVIHFLEEQEAMANDGFTPSDEDEITEFDESHLSPHPLSEGTEKCLSFLSSIVSRYTVEEFQLEDEWMFEHLSLHCMEQIGLNAAAQGAHDVMRDALKICACFEKDSEWAVRFRQIPYAASTMKAALALMDDCIGTTAHERDVCEYLAVDEWLKWKGAQMLKTKYNDANGLQKVLELKSCANPNHVKGLFQDKAKFCTVRLDDSATMINHGIYELEGDLRIRTRLIYAEETKINEKENKN